MSTDIHFYQILFYLIYVQVFEELTKAIYENYKKNKRQSPIPEVAKLRYTIF